MVYKNSNLSDEDMEKIKKLIKEHESRCGRIKEPTAVEKIKIGLSRLFR